jgi:predicted secreted protein
MTNVEVRSSGEHVTVAPGDLIVVRLEDISAGTGYEWRMVSELGGPLELESDSFEAPSQAPGAAAMRRLAFRSRERGTARVELARTRGWAPDEPPEARFAFTVTVR